MGHAAADGVAGLRSGDSAAFGVQRPGDKLLRFAADCIEWGVQRAVFVRSVSDRISLA